MRQKVEHEQRKREKIKKKIERKREEQSKQNIPSIESHNRRQSIKRRSLSRNFSLFSSLPPSFLKSKSLEANKTKMLKGKKKEKESPKLQEKSCEICLKHCQTVFC